MPTLLSNIKYFKFHAALKISCLGTFYICKIENLRIKKAFYNYIQPTIHLMYIYIIKKTPLKNNVNMQ